MMCSVLIMGMALVNIVGVVWGGRLQVVITIVKVGFLSLVALAPFLAVPVAGWTVNAENYSTSVPSEIPLAAQIAAVLLAVMWAYDGWHGITPLAEEVRDPQRNIPFALFGGIGVLILLYVAANVAYHGVLTMQEMQAAGDHAAEHMLLRLAGPVGQRAMSIVIMCSTFGAINSNLLMAPRITFAMGRDRVFFSSLGKVHATWGTPVIAILTTSLMSVGLIAAINLGKFAVVGRDPTLFHGELSRKIVQSLHDDSTFALMTNFFTFSASIFYALSVCAVIVLRIRRPQMERRYRVWGYPVVPILFVTVYAWFLSQAYSSNPIESRAGFIIIVLGVPVYFAYRWWRRTAQGKGTGQHKRE
jgi:amino acid transporter